MMAHTHIASELPDDALASERTAVHEEQDRLICSSRQVNAEPERLAAERFAAISPAADLATSGAMRDDLKHRLAVAESTLRQREEEVVQTHAELQEVLANSAALKVQLERRRAASEHLRQELSQMISTQEGALRASAQARVELNFALNQAKNDVRRYAELHRAREIELHEANSRLEEYFKEITRLSQLVLEKDASLTAEAAKREWLQKVTALWSNQPRWWILMPRKLRQKWLHRRLLRRGLFDVVAYLDRYPDVAATGLDPIEHYMRHGIDENRMI